MPNVLEILPEIYGEEQMFINNMIKDMDDKQAYQFANIYRTRRRDPQTILLVTLAGFLGFAGIQRFMTDQVGLGVLYFLTGGLCLIGTIVDLVNYKRLAFEFNHREAQQIAMMIKNLY
jgi:TM2 domain-containing membrane protein YozV